MTERWDPGRYRGLRPSKCVRRGRHQNVSERRIGPRGAYRKCYECGKELAD